jgi:hypothetical protein
MTRTLLGTLSAACALLATASAAEAYSPTVATSASRTGPAGARATGHLIQVVAGPGQPAKAPPKIRLYLIGWVDDAPAPHSRVAEVLVQRATPSRDGRSR